MSGMKFVFNSMVLLLVTMINEINFCFIAYGYADA